MGGDGGWVEVKAVLRIADSNQKGVPRKENGNVITSPLAHPSRKTVIGMAILRFFSSTDFFLVFIVDTPSASCSAYLFGEH
jgi:hypothetical protein